MERCIGGHAREVLGFGRKDATPQSRSGGIR
jgi:hypothetical protein